MLKRFRRSALPRGGDPSLPTAAATLSDGPVELPTLPHSPPQPPIQNAFEGNPLPPLSQYAYLEYNDSNGGNAYPELVTIDLAEHAPEGPDGWRERGRKLCKKKSVWALIVLLLVLVICLVVGLGLLWQKGDKGKTDRSSLTRSTAQPSSAKPDINPTNPITITNPPESSPRTTTRTKRITTVTSTIRTTLAPSAPTTFPLWIGTFDSISPLVSFSGACKTSTSPNILQVCAENARFITTIAESKPDGYTIGTTLWVFQDHLVPTERSGKQWYYSGNSVEKKYSHPSSPSCEVVEKAGLWLGKDGTYMLGVNYESTGACTLDSGRTNNPTAQVCECMYEGVFATLS